HSFPTRRSSDLTATWQLSCLPSWPQYCRATPTECRPFLGKPVSSMIQASTGPWSSIAGNTISRTLAKTFSSDQLPSPTKCNNARALFSFEWPLFRVVAVTGVVGTIVVSPQPREVDFIQYDAKQIIVDAAGCIERAF